jgi:transposase
VDLFHAHISVGTLHTWIKRCAQHLSPIETEIKTALQQVPVLHQDETGWYVMGKRHWMHVACTPTLTHYAVPAKRGLASIDDIGIAPAFRGISLHDGWPSYRGYHGAHALCNVHHLRELTFVEEEHQQDWATGLKDLLLQMKDAVTNAKAIGQCMLSADLIAVFEAQYGAWLRQADTLNPADADPVIKKRGVVRCLIDRLHSQKPWVLRFLHRFDVPFDNSQAERDIRMLKVQQKVSGCFRSQAGAHAFCRIRGYLSTMRKQNHTSFSS